MRLVRNSGNSSHMIRTVVIGGAIIFLALTFAPDLGASHSGMVTPHNNDCQVTVATDGTPPIGTPQLDPSKLCDGFDRAEQTAACMGNWQLPAQLDARGLCIEEHQRGCGNPQQNCDHLSTNPIYHSR